MAVPLLRGPDKMVVIIDQARYHRPPLQIRNSGCRTSQGLHVDGGSDRQDPIALDGDRGGDAEIFIDGQNLAIDQYSIRNTVSSCFLSCACIRRALREDIRTARTATDQQQYTNLI